MPLYSSFSSSHVGYISTKALTNLPLQCKAKSLSTNRKVL